MSAEDIRARIAALSKPDIVAETLPNWGLAHFRRINAEARFQILALQEEQQAKGQTLPAAVAIAVTLCDESGDLVYADLAEGLRAINALPVAVHDELAGVALRVSGLGAKALEDAEGKS
jgi:hypothetical protein